MKCIIDIFYVVPDLFGTADHVIRLSWKQRQKAGHDLLLAPWKCWESSNERSSSSIGEIRRRVETNVLSCRILHRQSVNSVLNIPGYCQILGHFDAAQPCFERLITIRNTIFLRSFHVNIKYSDCIILTVNKN